jgi:putative peptide zinc metalloprotease protein
MNLPAEKTVAPGWWQALDARLAPAAQKPQALPGTKVSRLEAQGEVYYMLKSPRQTFLRLSERDYFLWSQLDGQRDLLALALAYQQKYHAFAFDRILTLLETLKQNRFLVEEPIQLYAELRRKCEQTRAQGWLEFVQKRLVRWEIALPNIDPFISFLYRSGGRWLFGRGFLVLSLLGILGGLIAFAGQVLIGQYYLFSLNQPLSLNLLWLALGYFAAIMLHELGHALAVKHYGGEVNGAGFMFMFGLPAFYVNTSDIWLCNRRARILTSWAGPHTNLLVGGVCSLGLLLMPQWSGVLFPLAFNCYLGAVFNLNVLLELDGYYMLIDWLETPGLRKQAFRFLREEAWQKFNRREKFSRQEQIFGWFGTFALLYTVFTVFYVLWTVQNQLTDWLSRAFREDTTLNRLFFGVAGLGLLCLVIFSLGPLLGQFFWHSYRWLGRLCLQNECNLALSGWIVGGITAIITYFAGQTIFLTGFGLIIAVGLLRGSYPIARRLSLAIAGFSLHLALNLDNLVTLLLATLGLIWFGLALLRQVDFNQLDGWIQRLLVGLALLGLIIGLPGVAWTTQAGAMLLPTGWLAGFIPGASLLSLALTILILSQQWNSRFQLAHLHLLLAQVLLIGYSFYETYRQVALLPEATPLVIASAILTGLAGLLYHFSYWRGVSFPARQADQWGLPDQTRLHRAGAYLMESGLATVSTTFGVFNARRVAGQLNGLAAEAEWPFRINANLQVEKLATGETSLFVTGLQVAQALEQTRLKIGQQYGQLYARNWLERAIASLHWEERELAEEYIFPQLPDLLNENASGADNEVEHLLASLPIFAESSPAELRSLANAVSRRHYRPGQTIIRQGEPGDTFYIVKSGQVNVWQQTGDAPPQLVNTHGPGSYFGEVALLRSAPRNATCRAAGNVMLYCLEQADFDRLARRYFELGERVKSRYERLKLLQSVFLFQETSLYSLKELASHFRVQDIAPGDIIIRQGEPGDAFYLIEDGEVEISRTPDAEPNAPPQVLDTRRRGEFFGEIALLLNVSRTATVHATQPTRLLRLERDDFLRLVCHNRRLKNSLDRVASRRIYERDFGHD